jgi:integrase
MTHAEEAKLEPLLREGYGHAVRFALAAGFRLANLVALRPSDIDFEGRQIHLRQKGDKNHTIPLTAEVDAIVREAMAEHGDPRHVFMFRFRGARRGRGTRATTIGWTNSKSGRRYEAGAWYPITRAGLRSWWVDVTKAAGIEDVSLHDLRRTAGSRLLLDTGNVKLVQRPLGRPHDRQHLRPSRRC